MARRRAIDRIRRERQRDTRQQAAVALADQPVFASSDVPGNLALALSVEYPTAISVANLGDYADASEYLGYFDPKKCYSYQANTAAPAARSPRHRHSRKARPAPSTRPSWNACGGPASPSMPR